MGCCGDHTKSARRRPTEIGAVRLTRPTDQCEFCAEKHLSAAHALANESGYAAVNRQSIIGQLALAGWHLWEDHRDLAVKSSALRHDIQHRKPVDESRWVELLTEIDALATAAAEELKKQETP